MPQAILRGRGEVAGRGRVTEDGGQMTEDRGEIADCGFRIAE
jgi:hypothetical protein